MANRPQGWPFRLIALHLFRFVQPFLKPAMRIALSTRGFRLPKDVDWALLLTTWCSATAPIISREAVTYVTPLKGVSRHVTLLHP